MSYHALTHVSGAIFAVLAVMIAGFTVLSIRGYIAHRRTEASSHAARGSSANSFLFGLSLPTLLRLSFVGACLFSCLAVLMALLANWLVLNDPRDEGLRYVSPGENPSSLDVSPVGKYCMALTKLGPALYVCAKACSYLFFFFKSRTVAANQKMTWFHKGVLFVTLQMFVFAASGFWLVQGDLSALDRTCIYWIPNWLLIVMAVADAGISAIYCYFFVAPLRETINANKAMRHGAAAVSRAKVSPADPVVSPASAAAAAAAAARGSALEQVLHRNMVSCVGSIVSTLLAMTFAFVSHVVNEPHMRKATLATGILDATITCFSIAHLMRKSNPAPLAASHPAAAQVAPAPRASAATSTGAGGGAADAPVLIASTRSSIDHSSAPHAAGTAGASSQRAARASGGGVSVVVNARAPPTTAAEVEMQ